MHHHHRRYHKLFHATVKRLPKGVWPIKSLDGVRVGYRAKDGVTAGVVYYNSGGDRFRLDKNNTALKQRITFYASLLDGLSDKAVMAIMAHEIGHAWLNDSVEPEQSTRRERMADALVMKWGFDSEVAALDAEAESVN